jgi:GxxExxY protein
MGINTLKNSQCLVSLGMTENEISSVIIREAINVHKILGPGLLEKVYIEALYHKLLQCGLKVFKEYQFPIIFEEIKIECGYRVDLFVEDKVIVEAKSIDQIAEIHVAQTPTYLRLSRRMLGLIINFNVRLLKNGIKRVVNNL